MSLTLDDIQARHVKAVLDLQNQNALRAQIASHEQTLTGLVNRWDTALERAVTAFQPPAVTRPLMPIPQK
jgi:hypothetical protein